MSQLRHELAEELLAAVVRHVCLTPDGDYFDYGVREYKDALEYLAGLGVFVPGRKGRWADAPKAANAAGGES